MAVPVFPTSGPQAGGAVVQSKWAVVLWGKSAWLCWSGWEADAARSGSLGWTRQRYFTKGETNDSPASRPSACWVPLFSETAELQVHCEDLCLVLSLWLSAQWEISHFWRGCSHYSRQAPLSLEVSWALQAAPHSPPEGHYLWVTCGNSPGYVMQ